MSFGQCQKCKAYFTRQEYNARIGNNIGLCFKCIPILKQQRDDLLTAIKKAHKEGYVDGYADGVATDGCVENNIIDQDDWAKAWNQSEAIANCEA